MPEHPAVPPSMSAEGVRKGMEGLERHGGFGKARWVWKGMEAHRVVLTPVYVGGLGLKKAWRPTLWSSHQSTLGRPVSPAAFSTCVGFTCTAQQARRR